MSDAPFSLLDESNNGNDAASAARLAAMAAASPEKRGRGRPRKDGTHSSGTSAAKPQSPSPELRAELAKQLESLYDPKAWGSLLAAPGDAALAITGKDHWKISNDERATMGATGATAARFLVLENPKTLAMLMLGASLFSVYMPRLTAELKLQATVKKSA